MSTLPKWAITLINQLSNIAPQKKKDPPSPALSYRLNFYFYCSILYVSLQFFDITM